LLPLAALFLAVLYPQHSGFLKIENTEPDMGFVPPFMKRLQHPTGHFPSNATNEAKELYSNGAIVVKNKNNYDHLRCVFLALDIELPDTVDPEILFQTLQERNDSRAILPVEPDPVEPGSKKKRPTNVSEAMSLRNARDPWEDSIVESPTPEVAPESALEAAEDKVEPIDAPAPKKQSRKKTPATTQKKTSVKDVSNI
jgi:hypothetical protein